MAEARLSSQDRGPELGTISLVLVAVYLAAQTISDIASLKIGTIFTLSVDMGTFLYPLTFTLRDLVHKNLGKKTARTLIWAAAGINFAMSAYLAFASAFPADQIWDSTIPGFSLQTAFAAVLAPMWRIVVASIVAELVSELVDTEIYGHLAEHHSKKPQWLRVLASNSVAIPIDNFIFAFGAFHSFGLLPGDLPLEVVWGIFAVNFAVKFAVTLVSLPFIYLVPARKE